MRSLNSNRNIWVNAIRFDLPSLTDDTYNKANAIRIAKWNGIELNVKYELICLWSLTRLSKEYDVVTTCYYIYEGWKMKNVFFHNECLHVTTCY